MSHSMGYCENRLEVRMCTCPFLCAQSSVASSVWHAMESLSLLMKLKSGLYSCCPDHLLNCLPPLSCFLLPPPLVFLLSSPQPPACVSRTPSSLHRERGRGRGHPIHASRKTMWPCQASVPLSRAHGSHAVPKGNEEVDGEKRRGGVKLKIDDK